MNVDNITSISNIIISRQIVDISCFFFMLLAVKSSEIFPEHKGNFFILESFALNWYIYVALTNKKSVASIIMQT